MTEDSSPPMASGAIEFADVDFGATLTDSFTATTVNSTAQVVAASTAADDCQPGDWIS
jgi:hypothetical protein